MDLRQLKQLWKEHGFRPNKRLGQNFLIDKNVRDNILRALSLDESGTVVEIGSGFGVMSFALAERCGKLFAVEKDSRICEIMGPYFRGAENLKLVHADILEVDICGLAKQGERITVFGNIPYYISTPVIERMIEQRRCVGSVHIVIQEELADRIVSPPGSRVYGSVSCYIQFYTRPKKLFRIKKNSFYPRPKVDSCLLSLEMLPEPSVRVKDEALMFKIIRKAFSQRRKKIINPLSDRTFTSINRTGWEELLNRCRIDPANRAENLSLSDYARLADAVGETVSP